MATLRDIYRYVNPHTAQALGRGDLPHTLVNNTDLRDEDFYAQMQALQVDDKGVDHGSFDYSRERGPDSQITNNFTIRPGAFLANLERDHAGAVNYGASPYSEGSGRHLSIDGSKLPQTRFGDISRTAAVDEGTDLQNPNLVYDDPVYGRIAPLMNIKGNDELGVIVQAIMSAMTAGMAALPGAAMGIQGVNAARSIGSGGNPLSSLASLAGGAFGIDPNIMRAIRGALSLSQLGQARGGKP